MVNVTNLTSASKLGLLVKVGGVTNATKRKVVANVTIFALTHVLTNMSEIIDNNVLIDDLKGKDYFTSHDLRAWYNDHGIEVTDESLRVKIHRLKSKGILHTIARGKYVIGRKPVYKPLPDKFISKVRKLFLSAYDDLDYCIWSTKELQNLMHHIPAQFFYVFETEKDATETIFNHLKDNGINAYYQPNKDQVYRYVVPEEDAIIVRPLVSRAPCITVEKISMPSLEKVLVDLFCDTEIYYAYGGTELKRIYENALEFYAINFSTLLHYAERRKNDKEIRAFLLDNFKNQVKNILS